MPLSSPKTLSPPSVTVPGGNRSPSVRMTQLLRRMASAPEKPATALPLLASRAAMRLSGSAHTIGNASRFALASITERFHASSAFCFVSSVESTPNTTAAARKTGSSTLCQREYGSFARAELENPPGRPTRLAAPPAVTVTIYGALPMAAMRNVSYMPCRRRLSPSSAQ